MEYLDDEPRVLAEVARIVAPGGTVIVTLPNYWSPYRVWLRSVYRAVLGVRERLGRGGRRTQASSGARKNFVQREYIERAYRRALRRVGLEPVDVCYYNFKVLLSPFDSWLPGATVRVSRRLEPLGRYRLLRFLATGFIIKAVKAPPRA
jgi:SAM-dependent methyltransferase